MAERNHTIAEAQPDPVYELGRRLLKMNGIAVKYDEIHVGQRKCPRACDVSHYIETTKDATDAIELAISTTRAQSLPGAAVQLMLLAARLDLGDDLSPDDKTWRELRRLCGSALQVVLDASGVGPSDIPLDAYMPSSEFPDDFPDV